jgi:hypothetical protein
MRRLWAWLRPMLVQEVPEEIAVCEFICAEPVCRVQDWQQCELWRSYQGIEAREIEADPSIPSPVYYKVPQRAVH